MRYYHLVLCSLSRLLLGLALSGFCLAFDASSKTGLWGVSTVCFCRLPMNYPDPLGPKANPTIRKAPPDTMIFFFFPVQYLARQTYCSVERDRKPTVATAQHDCT